MDNADSEFIGTVEYFPYQGFPGYYFPFLGVKNYLSPLVAVHFKNISSKYDVEVLHHMLDFVQVFYYGLPVFQI